MNRRPIVGIINTLQASGDNVKDDTVAEHWGLCDIDTADPVNFLHTPIPYGKTLKVESFSAVAEVQQLVLIGGAVAETITANTRYKLEIHNPEDKYESHEQPPAVHAYSTGATIPAAAAARELVYKALVDKVNNYAGNNAVASSLTLVAYTLGTSTGDATETFVIGETLTQETSGITARVAAFTLTSGTFAGDDAAGDLWLFDISDEDSWDAGTKTWTATAYAAGVTSGLVVTGTAASQVHGDGLVIEDDPGYFVSKLGRPGLNWVATTQGFVTASAGVILEGAYALGIGSVMAALKPVYDHSKQEVVNHGDLAYEFTRGDVVDPAKEYTKVVLTIRGGDEDSIDGRDAALDNQITIYLDESNGTNLTNCLSAISDAAVK